MNPTETAAARAILALSGEKNYFAAKILSICEM
jgi:hypothetical protein